MCRFLVALVFLLALGAEVKPLNAEETNMTISSIHNTISPDVTSEGLLSEEANITDRSPDTREFSNHQNSYTTASPTNTTSPTLSISLTPTTSPTLTTSQVLSTSPTLSTSQTPSSSLMLSIFSTLQNMSEHLTTLESTSVPVSDNMMTYDSSTPVAPESTSQPEQEQTSTITITTTEPPLTQSPSPTIPDLLTISTKPIVFTPTSASDEDVETTKILPATTPSTIPTTADTITNIQDKMTSGQNDFSINTEETGSTYNTSGSVVGVGSSKEESRKGPNWLIVGVIALFVCCIITILCVTVVVIKRRKQSGKQSFGFANGQRSKKKKATEDDVWAGPVRLGGVDCETSEIDDTHGEEKVGGVETTGLITFNTVEENGGVGRPGSPEVNKWEEKEPLLYIDEEGKNKGKEKEGGKSEDAEEGKSEVKEVEPDKGETFCLTTAV